MSGGGANPPLDLLLLIVLGVLLDERLPLFGYFVFVEDGLYRALGGASSALYALIGIDVELLGSSKPSSSFAVNAFDRTYLSARCVLTPMQGSQMTYAISQSSFISYHYSAS